MIQDQTELISEKELIGLGAIYWQEEYLGECDYRVKMRTSRLKNQREAGENQQDKEKASSGACLITTMIGMISIEGNPYGSIYKKRNQLTLHLNEDFLMPFCAFPSSTPEQDYKIYGRVISGPVENLDD